MACNNKTCGCTTPGKTTLPGCTPFVCNDPNPCQSIIDSCCIKYTGDNIVDASISTGQSLCNIIPQLVTYMTPPEPEPITCSTPTNCCGAVTGFDYSSITTDPSDVTKYQIQLIWNINPECEIAGYVIQYRILNTATWTTVNIASFFSAYFIGGLIPGVYYEFRMYVACEAEPCYSVTISVQTPIPPCNDPNYCAGSVFVNIAPLLATQTTLTWTWNQNPNADSYQLQFYNYSTGVTTYISVPQSPSPTLSYTAIDLEPGSTYYLIVYSVCPDGTTNTLCGTQGFAQTTLGTCISVLFTNAGNVIDTFSVYLCDEPTPTGYSVAPGHNITLCVQNNRWTGINNTTFINRIAPCP